MNEWHQQTSTFHDMPSAEAIERKMALLQRRIAGPLSYVLYIQPVAERFGDRVYEVAARSLNESGIPVTAEQLKSVAEELKTPEGKARYEQARWEHIWAITPIRKPTDDW